MEPALLLIASVTVLILLWKKQASVNRDAAEPFQAQGSDPETAKRRLMAVLTGDGWELRSDWEATKNGQSAFFGPKSKLRTMAADWGVRVSVGNDGTVRAALANNGAYIRQWYGFIPTGPKMPVGGHFWVKLKKRLVAASW